MNDFNSRNGEDKDSIDGGELSEKPVLPEGWVEQYLSSMPIAPSGFQVSSVIMITTRLEGAGEGQLSREQIIAEINELGVDSFIDKYTEDRRFFSKKTGTAIRRPDPEILRRAAELRATDTTSGFAQGVPRRSLSTTSMPAAVPTTPVPAPSSEAQPGSLLAGVRRATAEVFSALTRGRNATSRGQTIETEGETETISEIDSANKQQEDK